MEETNVEKFAKKQFDLLKSKEPGAIILNYKNEILDICKKMGEEGLSYMAASMYRQIIVDTIDKLLQFKPITPIYGTDEEWNKQNDGDGDYYQHKYYGALFKNEQGKVYDVDLIVNKTKYRIINGEKQLLKKPDYYNGVLFATKEDAMEHKNRIRIFIKKFPYNIPAKPFYIDMIEEDTDDGTKYWINDIEQLKELDDSIYEIVYDK